MVLDSFGALRTLKTHYVCGLCDVIGDTDLDDFIEVTFTVSPQLRRLPFHDPETLSVEDFHWKLRFSTMRMPGQHVRFLDVLQGFVRGMTFLPPGTTATLRADLGPGALAGVNVQTQAAFAVPIAVSRRPPTQLRVRNDGSAFLLHCRRCRTVPSSSRWKTLEICVVVASDQLAARSAGSDDQAGPRVRAVRVWRDAACATDLSPAVPLGTGRRARRPRIRQVTLLFTDLKGSTAMYERLGDLNAYALVRSIAVLGAAGQERGILPWAWIPRRPISFPTSRDPIFGPVRIRGRPRHRGAALYRWRAEATGRTFIDQPAGASAMPRRCADLCRVDARTWRWRTCNRNSSERDR